MSESASGTILYKNDRCCQDFKDSSSALASSAKRPCQTDYKGSAPSYSHKLQNFQCSYSAQKNTDLAKTVGTVIIEKPHLVHTAETCPYRTRCYQCKDFVLRIRSLLDEMKSIRKNVTTHAICDVCKRFSASGKCRRCEYLQDRYKISENIEDYARQQRFKIWLCKVKQFLYTILERETCKHKVYTKTPATDELTNLLHELKSPLTIREPNIVYFPTIDSLENITESKDILEEVLIRLNSEKRSEDFMPEATCVCKYFADKKFEDLLPAEKEMSVEDLVPPPTTQAKDSISDMGTKKDKLETDVAKKLKDLKGSKQRKESFAKPAQLGGAAGGGGGRGAGGAGGRRGRGRGGAGGSGGADGSGGSPRSRSSPHSRSPKRSPSRQKQPKDDKKSTKPSKEDQPKKGKADSEDDMMKKLMKTDRAPREVKPSKSEKPPPMPKIEELPKLKVKPPKPIIVQATSESVMECNVDLGEATEMIKGTRIVAIEPRKEHETGSVQPMFFKVAPVCQEPEPGTPSAVTASSGLTTPDKTKKGKTKTDDDEKSSNKGIIRYMLSDREFIEKGWTQLPTTKIMRRMNIYKMVPANPKFDWFERHKSQRMLNYDTGEKLAEFEDDGSAKLYYKNGNLALAYYCAQDSGVGFRYVVYSSGENLDAGRKLPVTVLASFDFQGNGVVYDHYGNERLKYNQSEGMVLDEKIGPPGRWKWHTLNEPPVLQPVFSDVKVRPNNCLEEFFRTSKDVDKSENSKHKKEPNLDMLAIELENFLKEKAQALLQEFKPFQIRMKALKVNDQFSLKVIDQANIYLMFREGPKGIKLNLGLLLISNEIIDTDTAEVTQVATPYDRRPPKSESIADIQVAIERARKLGKVRGKLRN